MIRCQCSRDLKIFTCNANRALAEKIVKHIGTELGALRVDRFADGEIDVQILESVRGADCYIVQPTCTPVNENLMELLITIDAMRRASAGRITAVIPYYGYARADRKSGPRVPITSKLVANLLANAGADRVMSMDLHAGQIQGFFDIPVDHLRARGVFLEYFLKNKPKDLVVVSPDVGGVERARKFAARMDAGLVIIDKRRPKANEALVYNIIGDVQDKTVIIVDDIVDTAGTLSVVANKVKENGAKKIYAVCTHGVLSRDGVDKVEKSAIEKIFITDTLPEANRKQSDKIHVLTISHVFADAILRNHDGRSISEMFK
ncbi:MAG: ribose-phosphate pyrophosphokinase [Elusimicrobiota bacterium]|jgi:ribose-phosphate pyrophosphokinase|nr:ribose-phosphate pyrophosphokinase [Elusimicrobiota bacterium]